ncbi:MAG: glycine zipper domain-containing protein, partial [Gemmatimonadaceae bacterium]
MANNMRHNLDSGDAGLAVGESIGGIGGLAAGAVIGSLAGPVGTLIGAIAGAVGGWWAGREVAETAEAYSQNAETHYRAHFEADEAASDARDRFASYDHARPLYQLGYVASQNPDYAGRSFDDVEPDIRRGWTPELERQYGSWNDARGTVSKAYDSGIREGAASSARLKPRPRLVV